MKYRVGDRIRFIRKNGEEIEGTVVDLEYWSSDGDALYIVFDGDDYITANFSFNPMINLI